MPTDPSPARLRLARRLLARRDPHGQSDADLLGRFADARDEDAFAALLDRHGPMVLGVCRRAAGHPDDADDAFQAAFLVLARRAAAVRRRPSLAAWLYGVALRVARDARRRADRRRALERTVDPRPPAAHADGSGSDLRAVLDDELGRLPEKYRAPVVLHHLEGLTKPEVARRLGWPEGTVAGRLDRARALLRARLTRRGVAAPAGLLAAGVGSADAPAALPADVRDAAVRAVLATPAGPAVTRAAALAEGLLRASFAARVKVAAAVVLASGVVAAAALSAGDGRPADGAVVPRPAHAAVRVGATAPPAAQRTEPGEPDPAEGPDEFDEPGPRERAVDRLAGLPLDRWQASWPADLDADREPAGAVLRGLLAPLGLTAEAADGQEKALARPVTLSLRKKGRLELVEEVCRRVGLYPVYPDGITADDREDRAVRLAAGPRPRPVAFAGPFLVEVAEVKSSAETATGELGLRLLAVGLPPAVALPLRHGEPLQIGTVSGPGGQDLLDPGRRPHWAGSVSYCGLDTTKSVPLRGLVRGVAALGVRGRVRVPVATRVEAATFRGFEPGAEQTAGGAELTLREVTGTQESVNGGLRPRVDLQFEFRGADLFRLEFVGYDGGRLRPLRWNAGGAAGAKQGVMTVGFRPPLTAVAVKVLAGVEHAEYPFRLADVEVPGRGTVAGSGSR